MSTRIDILLTEHPIVDASMTYISNITANVLPGYSFLIEAQGGFASAHLQMQLDAASAFQMLERVGKRIVFLNDEAPTASLIVWEGVLSSVTVEMGSAALMRTLDQVFNRVTVHYSVTDNTTSPPTVGLRASTASASNAASQAAYGIRDLAYSIGGSNATDAAVLRDALLAQYAWPISAPVSLERGAASKDTGYLVTVECVGFFEEANVKFPNVTGTTVRALDVLISNRIAAGDLQGIATGISGIVANTLTRSEYTVDQITFRTYFDGLCAMGDGATSRRRFFGVYENRVAAYTVEPSAVGYYTYRNDASNTVYDASTQQPIRPWLLRPGVLISVLDLMPDEVVLTAALLSARTFLIDSVEFTSPMSVKLTPMVNNPSALTLARMGLSAIGG